MMGLLDPGFSVYHHGKNIFTVGDDGNFATIAEALYFISTQPTMELLATTAVIDCNQWKNFAPLVSGSLGDARPGDFLFLDNDDPGIDIYQHDNHYYRILSAIDNATEAMPGVYLESGVLGTTQAGYTAKIYRPAKFTIQLMSGDHSTTDAVMPDGYDITIRGLDRSTTVSGSGIAMPRYGNTVFSNFIQTGTLTKSDTRTVDLPNNLLDAGFDCVEMRDMWCEGESVYVLGNHAFQSVRMTNVPCTGFKGHRFYGFLYADYMHIEDVWFDSITSMELCEIIHHPRRCDSSHKKIVKNCRFRRSEDHSSITASGHNAQFTVNIQPLSAGMPNYEMDFINCSNIDDGLNVAAEGKAVFGILTHSNPATGSKLRFIDSEMINNNSHNYDVASISGYEVNNKLQIEFIRTKGANDEQVTCNAGNAIIRHKNEGAFQNLDYVGGIVPYADLASNIIVGTLTGNISVLDTVNIKKGQTVRFVFKQDATGGRTITWSGSKYKVHTNPVGAAGQKAVFEFLYDGTHMVQQNTTAWS